MPYEYLEEGVTADVTFRARASDLDGLFTAAADATTNVMVASLESIRPLVAKTIRVRAESLDLLLMRFLEELVFYKDAEAVMLRASDVHVESVPDGYQVFARFRGEPIDPIRHELLADVKGVTLHRLQVAREETGWRAEVTLDV